MGLQQSLFPLRFRRDFFLFCDTMAKKKKGVYTYDDIAGQLRASLAACRHPIFSGSGFERFGTYRKQFSCGILPERCQSGRLLTAVLLGNPLRRIAGMAAGGLCHRWCAGILGVLADAGPAGNFVDQRSLAGGGAGGPATAAGKDRIAAAGFRIADRGGRWGDLSVLAWGKYAHCHVFAAGGAGFRFGADSAAAAPAEG